MSFYSRKYINFISDSYALYGNFEQTSKAKMQVWFKYVVSLSEEFGYPFNEGSCTPGNTKMVLFRNCKRTFEKNLSNIESLELRHIIYRNDEELQGGGEIYARLDNDNNFLKCIFNSHIVSLNNKLRLEISIKLCEITRSKYGFFYKFPFVFSPWTYAYGLLNTEYDDVYGSKFYNEKHKDIKKRISFWRRDENQRKACEQGYLREIYPINFINEKHLSHEVFPKIALRNWIEEADHRGTLTQITDELHAWIIPDEDLEPITIALAPSDILLCINKEDPHRYDYGVRPEDQIVLEK